MDSLSSSFISTFSPASSSLLLRRPSSSRRLLRINSAVVEERSPISSNPTQNNDLPPTKPKKPLYTRTNNHTAVSSPSKPRPQTSLATALFTTVEEVINTFIDPPSRPSVDPKHVLSDNFAPVLDELPPTECEIIHGSLPPSLNGAYIRNGPNPQFLPRGPYHLFDGDGMLHAIRIRDGKATLCSRYVKTYKYSVEKQTGSPVIPNVFSGFNGVPASMARGALSALRVLRRSRMALEAWLMDDSNEDQRLPHHPNPKELLPMDYLAELGVLYWKLNPENYENDSELAKIRDERGYDYMDLLDLCPEKVSNYEEKLKNFFTEHIHQDERFATALQEVAILMLGTRMTVGSEFG